MTIAKKIGEMMERGSWIRRMFEEGNRLKAIHGARNVFDFTLGNPILPPPPRVQEALAKFAGGSPAEGHGYMGNAGLADVRAAVAAYHESLYGLGFEGGHVVMTTGAGGGMNVLLKALLDPGDEVIIIVPYFPEYLFYIDNHGGKAVLAPCGPGFGLDAAAVASRVTARTKAVIICSPNNPTGAVYDAASLERLGRALEEKEREHGTEIYLVNDEPYRKIIFDGAPFPSPLPHCRRTVVVTSHSKDFSIPGERIGYVAVNPRMPDCARLVNAMTFTNRVLGFVNAPALWQRVAGACQEASVDVGWYQEKRDLFCDALAAMGYEIVRPGGTFYIFPRTPDHDDIEFVRRAGELRLLVVPGSGFGLPGYFRIATCMSDNDTIRRSLPLFEKLIGAYGK